MSLGPNDLLTDAEGRHEQPIGPRSWIVVGCPELTGDGVVWRMDEMRPEPPAMLVTPGAGLVAGFYKLAEADGPAILDYARRWGRLGLCSHGLPATHDPRSIPEGLSSAVCGRYFEEREPLATWRYWARRSVAIGRLAADLRLDRPGTDDDWAVLLLEQEPWTEGGAWAAWRERRLRQATDALEWRQRLLAEGVVLQGRSWVAGAVSAWLALNRVGPQLEWGLGEPSLVDNASGLLGAIGLQLATAVASAGVVRCSGCGDPFVPSRRPAPARRPWCDSCRQRGRAHRRAQADYVARRRTGYP